MVAVIVIITLVMLSGLSAASNLFMLKRTACYASEVTTQDLGVVDMYFSDRTLKLHSKILNRFLSHGHHISCAIRNNDLTKFLSRW